MALGIIDRTVEDIKSLRIQGASAIRKAVVQAIKQSILESQVKTTEALRKELKENMLKLVQARPNEPEARTAVKIILSTAMSDLGLSELKNAIIEKCENYERDRELAMEEIATFTSNLVKNNSVIFTHCHSHTVEKAIIKCFEDKKVKEVYCTETRPLYQGRITAKNLVEAGIPTTLVVDSAAATFLRKADYFFTGADAILAHGDIINKIGTRQISHSAFKEGVPHYIITSSHKFDASSIYGQEIIEERSPTEVWPEAPPGLKIKNPAFDITESKYIKAIICEKGILSPHMFVMLMLKEMHLEKHRFISVFDMLK